VLEASLIIPLGIASDRSSPAAFRLALRRAGDLKGRVEAISGSVFKDR